MADRILVYGVTGSGKTSLAERISRVTGIPWYAVDELTWEPGWVAVPDDEQRRRVEEICSGERWMLDTAYGRWLDVPLARVELVVALDFPRWLSLFRLTRRSIARAIDGKPVCNGNRESFRNLFSRDSIIAWHFRSFSRKRERIRRWDGGVSGLEVVRLTSPAQVERWLAALGGPGGAADYPVGCVARFPPFIRKWFRRTEEAVERDVEGGEPVAGPPPGVSDERETSTNAQTEAARDEPWPR